MVVLHLITNNMVSTHVNSPSENFYLTGLGFLDKVTIGDRKIDNIESCIQFEQRKNHTQTTVPGSGNS